MAMFTDATVIHGALNKIGDVRVLNPVQLQHSKHIVHVHTLSLCHSIRYSWGFSPFASFPKSTMNQLLNA